MAPLASVQATQLGHFNMADVVFSYFNILAYLSLCHVLISLNKVPKVKPRAILIYDGALGETRETPIYKNATPTLSVLCLTHLKAT